jgi:hypothetical protein
MHRFRREHPGPGNTVQYRRTVDREAKMLPAARAGLLAELRQEQQEQRDRQRVVLRQHGMIFAEDCVTESTADRALSMAGESKSKWEQVSAVLRGPHVDHPYAVVVGGVGLCGWGA